MGEPLQFKAEVASFLQGSSEALEDEDEEMLPEPSISKSTEWVQWRAKKCDIPDWWAELSTVLEEDTGRLAREVRASFPLPRCMHELEPREASFHVPQLHHVSTNRGTCPLSYLSLLAGTLGKFPGRRHLHMPGPCSTLWSKITCQRGTSHAFWQRA